MSFAYALPASLDEAFSLLRQEPEARVLSGGTDLLIGLRKGTIRPPLVVDLKAIPELGAGITEEGGWVRIGASTVITDIVAHPTVSGRFPALVEAALVVGSIQIRNRASLAGNVCNASPAADTVPPLLVAGAEVEIVGYGREHRMALEAFLLGPGQTALEPGELVRSIRLPLLEHPVGWAFGRMTRRRGVDLATVNLACSMARDGVTTFAFGAVGPRAFIAVDRSGVLADDRADRGARDEILRELTSAATPITNVRATREYRQEMLLVLGRRAADTARSRLREASDGR